LKITGFLFLLAGWLIALTALILLPSLPSRTIFVLAGIAIEAIGFVLAAKSHLTAKGTKIAA